jgi:flagellar motility protein MotE (MotC chaperone)
MLKRRLYHGGVIVPVLCLLVGIVVGAAAILAPRMFLKLDPMKYIKPDLAWTPPGDPSAEEEDAKPHPREVELRRMISEVQKQRVALAEREKPLLAREQEVQNQLKSIETIKTQIEEAEARIKKQQLEQNVDEGKNIKTLAKIWSQMEPAEAAKIVSSVDPELAVRVLYNMPNELTAPIFATLVSNPDTEKLAVSLTTNYKRLKALPKAEVR